MKKNKFKIPILILLSFFVSSILPIEAIAQIIPLPPTYVNDLTVTFNVQSSEKEIKVTTKNNTDDPLYKITTSVSSVSNGSSQPQSGTFDKIGGQIIQSFTNLLPKTQYTVVVTGIQVSPSSKSGSIVKTYTLQTNATKPGVVEVSSVTNPNPEPLPPVQDSNTNNTNTNPPQVTVTTPGTILTPAQIAEDKKGSGLIPCINTCDFNDVLRLVNNLITFLITTLFIPIIIILFMYAGFKYITAEGNPSKVANLKKMLGHIVVGMLLVLCSWLIVKTIITIVSSDEIGTTQFLK
jgi:hypothetical protein